MDEAHRTQSTGGERERRSYPGKKGSLIDKGEAIVRLLADSSRIWWKEPVHRPDRIDLACRTQHALLVALL